ncbi:sulfate adenylyltransferase [Micractinium conductrix]|uniref:sulfate adenylyltransferase n=1 Tax=Micractinium conductrix TaxID=554055 RepID=A0A2P6V9P4_9CHLO|nr:sulfate adenylyltransferase [Micractinium conductrix]|eukprot:PSC70809.1 sulfate adenylyltransferase [Micractinium conductrix]
MLVQSLRKLSSGALRPLLSQGAEPLAAAAAASRRAFSVATNGDTDGAIARGADGHILPHGGGSLVSLMAGSAAAKAARARCQYQLELTERQACDVELLTVGGFTPLDGFMNEDAYRSVVDKMRLPDGLLFGLPVVMDTRNDAIKPGSKVMLTFKGQEVATLDVESRWTPNKVVEVSQCYGSTSLEHPAVSMVATERGPIYLGGKVTGFELPQRVFDCQTPEQVRSKLPANTDVVAFQCRNPIHRAHYELFIRALDAPNVAKDGAVLVHPTCGPTQDDDIPGIVRYHTYEVLQKEVQNPRVRWAYLPYSMHMAGPREAIQHMIIRKNYGCTHFIIGRDMAGCKSSLSGEDFYGAYDAQDFAKAHAKELGMKTVPSLNVVFTEELGYVTADVAEAKGLHVKKLSGTKFRQMLRGGEDIPEWFAFKSVVQVLRDHQQHKQ